jgi:leader peptidase (prepilin peptidase)/N-methyltransferase
MGLGGGEKRSYLPVTATTFSHWFVYFLVFSMGASLGSFLNLVCYRLPIIRRGQTESGKPITLSYPPSRCGHCYVRIRWHDNLPIIGWLKRWGHCASCGASFSIRHAVWEVIAGLAFLCPIVVAGFAPITLALGGLMTLSLYGPTLLSIFYRNRR